MTKIKLTDRQIVFIGRFISGIGFYIFWIVYGRDFALGVNGLSWNAILNGTSGLSPSNESVLRFALSNTFMGFMLILSNLLYPIDRIQKK